jgi:hypothetical protein
VFSQIADALQAKQACAISIFCSGLASEAKEGFCGCVVILADFSLEESISTQRAGKILFGL